MWELIIQPCSIGPSRRTQKSDPGAGKRKSGVYSHELSSRQEGPQCQLRRPQRLLAIVWRPSSQAGPQKGKGRVCLGGKGDSEDRGRGKAAAKGRG